MSGTEVYKTPCPFCGGVVSYFWWDSDCGGNPGGSEPITCRKCKRTFNRSEWEFVIAAPEIAEKKAESRRSLKKHLEMWKEGKTPASIVFVKKAEEYLKRHEEACRLLREAVGEIRRGEWRLENPLSLNEGLEEIKKREYERKEREKKGGGYPLV